MRHPIFFAVSFAVLALFLRPTWCAQASKPGEWVVEWNQKSLSVAADGVPLSQVLLAIANKTNLEVHGIDLLKGEAQVNFSNLSLRAGLNTLLSGANYCLQEPSDRNDARYVLSVISYHPENTSAEMRKPTSGNLNTSSAVPQVAGYVPEQYRKLYGFAKNSDMKALRQAATTGDLTNQAIAVRLLAKLDPTEATSLATEIARNSDPDRRLDAVQSLGEMDNANAEAALGQALRDPDAGIRQAAVLGLNGQTSSNAIPLLTQALQDQDETIRRLALDLLAERGADGAASISEALQSDDPRLRDHARELLVQLSSAK